jgi:regulator of cell morphogenesis and NO signaling
MLNSAKTVRDIAVEAPGATRVFEKIGIDYCCGGAKPISEACLEAGVTMKEVAELLEQAEAANQGLAESRDWRDKSLTSLINYIQDKHHLFAREEMERLEPLLAKVSSVYGDRRPELPQIQALFADLKRELLQHMIKEENILFPHIIHMEEAASAGFIAPRPIFGTVRNPVRMMMAEHDGAGDVLRRIRRLSNEFKPPADACVSYQTLYSALEGFEQDLHQHIHLENNILFPGAVKLE